MASFFSSSFRQRQTVLKVLSRAGLLLRIRESMVPCRPLWKEIGIVDAQGPCIRHCWDDKLINGERKRVGT